MHMIGLRGAPRATSTFTEPIQNVHTRACAYNKISTYEKSETTNMISYLFLSQKIDQRVVPVSCA